MSSETVGAKMYEDDIETLNQFEEKHGISRSEALRRAVRRLDTVNDNGIGTVRTDAVTLFTGLAIVGASWGLELLPDIAVTIWTVLAFAYIFAVRYRL